ncbi:DUF1559 domain-containing protein [Blastopirellula marina]|uniref:DUF1559 domain-containing protein n=1 Tax=Blastopirellula marina DSM 3645 TaxID=314230 RepID=A3ZUF1_9BACT|nr:DUF1559 domain-containing protein [Blastopirellula marina]EAQ79861.1 hypothetical protein DSM3645_22014 [Blastopirellula marina DSM 3645]
MKSKRMGFTLVELLVVIAIIGALIALLLPAVQQAREAARRSSCQNQLKQMGLAFHNYHDTFLTLPAAYLKSAATGNSGNTSGLIWLKSLLPFLEQGNFHDQWNYKKGYNSNPDNITLVSQVIPSFLCPSDEPSMTYHEVPNYNYACNLGTTDLARTTPYNGVDYLQAPFEHAGRNFRFAAITDGLSHTILVGEVRQAQITGDYRGLIWLGEHVGFTTHYGPNTLSPDLLVSSYCKNDEMEPIGLPCAGASSTRLFSARSQHPGGVQVVNADGSVHFIPETIDLNTWRGMSGINDGQVLGSY